MVKRKVDKVDTLEESGEVTEYVVEITLSHFEPGIEFCQRIHS